MSEQLPLLPQPEPERRRDEGIARARDHAYELWKQAAEASFRRLCAERVGGELTAWDLRDRLHNDYPDITTHELRALGWLFKKYHAAKWIRPLRFGRYPGASRHAAPMRVWRVVAR